jgi:phosphatidylinositol alpha-1,6-mannosyltransferase
MRLLVVTNDFPPRPGGIQTYVHNLLTRLDGHTVTVLASTWPGDQAFDAAQPFRVVRDRSGMLLPTPRVLRRVVELVREVDAELVLFGAAFPLGLLAGRVTASTGVGCAGFTHGVEVAMARVPVARQVLGRVASRMRLLTAVSGWAAERVELAVRGRAPVALLHPGVSVSDFNPAVDGGAVRARYGLGDDPVAVCVSRLVRRKGQDQLIAVWPEVVARVPRARLLIAGGGPREAGLRRRAAASPAADRIHVTGALDWPELSAHYAAGDLFVMPCRTRWAGLDLEAFGIVFVEAAACGLAVIAGSSGGAPETVVRGETGLVVDGRDRAAIADAVAGLLADAQASRAMGAAGRARAEAVFSWEALASRLDGLLASLVTGPGTPAAQADEA